MVAFFLLLLLLFLPATSTFFSLSPLDGWMDGWRLVCGIPEGCSLQPVCAPASFKAVCFTDLNRYFHVCVNLAFQPRNSLRTANVPPTPGPCAGIAHSAAALFTLLTPLRAVNRRG